MIAPPWVGDLVFTQSLFRLLKQRYLDCRITVLAAPYLRTLLAKMPEVDRWLPSPFQSGRFDLKARLSLAFKIRKQGFTDVYLISNSWKSALMPFLAGIVRRIGWRGEMRYGLLNDLRIFNRLLLPLMYERFAALAFDRGQWFKRPLPRPQLATSQVELNKVVIKLRLDVTSRPVLAIAVGSAGGECKCWPINHQIVLARHYLQLGWQVWLLGGASESVKADRIQQATDWRCVDLTGDTDLGEITELLVLPKVLVAGDTGLLHLAAAVGTAVVGIYGSTTPMFTPPLTDMGVALWRRDSCSPCYRKKCVYGDMHCLWGITPQQVITAVEQLLLRQQNARVERNVPVLSNLSDEED